ncbi:MAG: replicative DNA helicase [Treponema sp.]|jgi:replicative DNA helicase|nr:replicative DNA helicase [Treponema sp.]
MAGTVPPHDDEAERAALGAMLMDSDAIATSIEHLRPGDFYSNANNLVYAAILGLFNKGVAADILTVTGELRQSGKLDQAGGAAYVASLTTVVPSSANIAYYAQTVQAYSLRRALLRVSGELSAKVFDETMESRIILEETQQRIFELSDNRSTVRYRSAKEVVHETIGIIESLAKSDHEYTGIPSGFDDLDKLTSGFHPSELIIIGARPSIGKTALALTMAANISIRSKRSAAYFTLEMPAVALMQRLLSIEARINVSALRSGFLSSRDFQNILGAAENIYEAPLYIVDMPNMRLMELRAQARRIRLQEKIEIMFIDYLGLISSEQYNVPRFEQISDISRSLKSLARELDIPIVALCQLNREAEKERPNLSSIRDSGSIEQDADVVMFIHRERESDKKNEAANSEGGNKTSLILSKQRNGPVGTVNLTFMPQYAKFESWAPGGSMYTSGGFGPLCRRGEWRLQTTTILTC